MSVNSGERVLESVRKENIIIKIALNLTFLNTKIKGGESFLLRLDKFN